MRRVYSLFAVGVCLCILSAQTHGTLITTLSFENITQNDAIAAAIGESQLFVDIESVGEHQVEFVFRNKGPEQSTIADIYFDNQQGALEKILSIDDIDPGVSYSLGAAPRKLPGRNHASPTFVVTDNFMLDADAPVGGPNGNGINPGESLRLLIELGKNVSSQNLFNDLITGGLRIGIHVQSFDGGGSESFVNVRVPEPASLSLLLLGLPGLLRRYRRA